VNGRPGTKPRFKFLSSLIFDRVPQEPTRTESRSRWLDSSRAELVVSRITATISIARQGPLVFSFASGPTAWAEVEMSNRLEPGELRIRLGAQHPPTASRPEQSRLHSESRHIQTLVFVAVAFLGKGYRGQLAKLNGGPPAAQKGDRSNVSYCTARRRSGRAYFLNLKPPPAGGPKSFGS
jgi:hypothetical protein